MENYNNLVLMLKDKNTGFYDRTMGSYEIQKNMEYIDKIYAVEEGSKLYILLTLTTLDIEEDWKFSGIFDLYNEEIFADKLVGFEESADDYNPKWILKIEYSEDHKKTEELLNELLNIHTAELERIIPLINPEDYTE